MMEYQEVKTRNGKTLYYRTDENGKKKLCSKAEFEGAQTVDQQVEEKDNKCIFCGQHADHVRFVNLTNVFLCETHYYSENIGKIAQKLNEVKI